MMRNTSLILLSAAAGAALTVITTQPRIVLDGSSANAAAADTYRQLALFSDIFERVRSDYVEKPDDGKLIESAINGMLAGLDPHSSYMDPKTFRDMQMDTRGEFGGLGIEVSMDDGLIKVVSPIDETPAAKAGVMANDIITHINDEPAQGLTLAQAVEKMRGPRDTTIKLKITRKGTDKPIEVSITRDLVRVVPVRSHLEDGDVGYIRITQFNGQTTAGLKNAIGTLTAQNRDKLKGFIVDLRNNPGGLVEQAVSVANAFLEARRNRIDARPPRGRQSTVQRPRRRRSQQGQAGHRADQRRLGLSLRDRGRRLAGSQTCDHRRHALLRQGIRSDRHPARLRQRSAASDQRALLHALGPLDPGERHFA